MANGTEPKLPIWFTNLITAILLVLFTWYVTTGKMDAVQENRLATVEKELDKKASKESVESMKEQLNKMDLTIGAMNGKIDRLLERK